MKQCLQASPLIRYRVQDIHFHDRFVRNCSHFCAPTRDIFSEKNKAISQEKLRKLKPFATVESSLKRPDRAAVLIPLCVVNKEPAVLFTVRSNQLITERGSVSFPGGRMDKDDFDFVHTALRETEEELGLPPGRVDVWGEFNPLPTRGGRTVVTPVLGYCGDFDITKLNINHQEVEHVFTRSVESLVANTAFTRFRTRHVEREGSGLSFDSNNFVLPVFLAGEHRIWGLTAIFLHQVLSVVAGDLYTFKLKHWQ